MRTFFFILTFLTLNIFSMSAQQKEVYTLTIEFTIKKHNKGSILLALYDSAETYMKKGLKNARVEVKEKKAVIVFEGLQKGSYGFSFFHDVNNNGKLDKNFLGIPKEPYGFSNDMAGKFGPPDFDKIAFEITEDTTLQVSTK